MRNALGDTTEEQSNGVSGPKRVFVISPIGSLGSAERIRADRFLKYIVRAALPSPDYEVERADEHDSPHAISTAMLDSILKSQICVADITGRNPNVFYELALAHAMDKHVVIMDSDAERSPFDIQDQRAVKYGLMPEEIESAITQLRAKVASIGAPSTFKDMMNPVATAFRTWTEQQKVASSGDSTEQLLLRAVERLERKVDQVDRRSDDNFEERTESISAGEIRKLSRAVYGLVAELENLLDAGVSSPAVRVIAAAGRNLLKRDIGSTSVDALRDFNVDAEYALGVVRRGGNITLEELPSRLL